MELKRIVPVVVVLLATFGLGYFFAVQVSRDSVRSETPETKLESKLPAEDNHSADRKRQAEFVPEFRELPNADEIKWPESDENLIDIFQIGGVYRESDVIAKSGETWLTLFENHGNYSLYHARANVHRLKTSSYTGDELDVRLTFDRPGIPILAVRNIKSLRPGKVNILYNRPSENEIESRNLPIGEMEDGYKQNFNLNESWYTLRVSTGLAKDGTKLGILVLEHKNEKQVIYSTQFVPGEKIIIGDLFWVGDLDNDGKLDVYLDTYDEKGGRGGSLFLSSEAEQDKLVKLVATFGVPGC